jgi:DNA-binding transcriptional MerR regulator
MNLLTLSEENYQELKEQLTAISRKLQELEPQDQFWDNSDVVQKLKVSERTLATWREKGMIRYSKIGNKVYYQLQDILQFLNDHANEVSHLKTKS